jgi:hypothetical protein
MPSGAGALSGAGASRIEGEFSGVSGAGEEWARKEEDGGEGDTIPRGIEAPRRQSVEQGADLY